MKKIMSLLLTAALLLTVCASAFAVQINITDSNANAAYNAYRLLDLSTSVGPVDAQGNPTTNYAYTMNSKYKAIICGVLKLDASTATDEAVINAISELRNTTGKPEQFANEVYAAIVAAGTITPEATGKSPLTVDQQGYYLIEEVTEVAGTQNVRSLLMLDTAGENALTVKTKKDVPTVSKKVYDNNEGFNDVSDYKIGDTVTFRIYGTVDKNLADYTTYAYKFTDTKCAGLTFNEGSVKVYAAASKDVNQALTEAQAMTGFTTSFSGNVMTISFTDLKDAAAVGQTITGQSVVVVEYTCTLNANAVVGADGNENKVYLEFSNDPLATGTGEHLGKTPEDVVVVFTFGLDVSKVDAADTQIKLEGAQFKLYSDVDCKHEIKLAKDSKGYYAAENGTETIVAGTNVAIRGLDADPNGTTYYLKEIAAPNGYNLLTQPVKLTFTGTYAHRTDYTDAAATTALTALKVEMGDPAQEVSNVTLAATANGSNVSITVENASGTLLPSTGGMGSTLFIVGGVALIAAAVVLLLLARKKRA